MPIGTVKFFNAAKGFGFITADEGRKDVFVPGASISAAGLSTLKAGQRISFEETPDGKGPKATNLKLLETPREPVAVRREAVPERAAQWTLYCDMSFEESEEVLTGLQAAGHSPRVMDYIVTPPNREELKRLAALLRSADQSLVRKYDHLFGELRLDDRFISENDFWDAIVEHPSLINGPVVATTARASVCHSPEALEAFLANQADDGAKPATRQKTLSPRLLSLMKGEVPQRETRMPAPGPDAPAITPVPKMLADKTSANPAEKPAAPKAAKPAKPPLKAAAKAGPKPAPKPVKSAKKPAKKPKTGNR